LTDVVTFDCLMWRPEDGATCKQMVTARWCPWV